ncbi:MAG: type II toxin-antitoxin system VapC family toxin [Fibrobacterota bacterium]
MAHEAFVDTSGFYALLASNDDAHARAVNILKKRSDGKHRFVTTDYIIDESVTLLQARGLSRMGKVLLEMISTSTVCRMEWMEPERFARTKEFYLKHADHPWSFTDCFSFTLMKELNIKEALTKDSHFKSAGFIPLL